MNNGIYSLYENFYLTHLWDPKALNGFHEQQHFYELERNEIQNQRENRVNKKKFICRYVRSECFKCFEGLESGVMCKFNKEYLIETE